MSFALLALLAAPLGALALTPQSGSTYTISPKSHSNLCLAPSANSNGAQLVTKSCDTADDIVWTYTSSGTFQNTATNLCVDVKDGGKWSGNKLQVWTCYPNNQNQAFGLSGENIQWNGNMCWDLTDGKSTEGNQIQIWNCYNGNVNQMWEFVDAEEVDSCDGVATNSLVTAATATATGTTTGSVTAVTDTTTASLVGGALYAEGTQGTTSSSTGKGKHSKPSGSSSTITAATAATGAATDSWNSTATTTSSKGSSSTGKVSSGSGDVSGYLQTSGTKIVDPSGNNIIWKGVNLGGWLVSENWMNGISDNSGNADRFMQNTLESRFGVSQTMNLLNAWYDNWLTSSDWDNIASLGYNSVRLPFGWRNLQNADGSWITDSSGNIDFTRLDWAIAQAKSRNIYVILVFHIWDTQQQQYSMISENTSDGQSSRDRAGKIWEAVAKHYLGEPIIAAYDAINEPTGSWGDLLQQDLYKAIRSVDSKRIIAMESISTNPANYGWTNVVYSWHEYNCMGGDLGSNQATLQSGLIASINTWNGYNIPSWLGEFMADGPTLDYILKQVNQRGVSWHSWTYTTVNMGRWGLWNVAGSKQVDVSSDSYDQIMSVWSNLGGKTRQSVTDQFQNDLNAQKRDYIPIVASPVAARNIKTFHGASRGHSSGRYSRRSRRNVAAVVNHGKISSKI